MTKSINFQFSKSFTSPALGNVWPGRVAPVTPKQAAKFSDLGYGKIQAVKKPAAKKKPAPAANPKNKK